jgi:hypothetical protein
MAKYQHRSGFTRSNRPLRAYRNHIAPRSLRPPESRVRNCHYAFSGLTGFTANRWGILWRELDTGARENDKKGAGRRPASVKFEVSSESPAGGPRREICGNRRNLRIKGAWVSQSHGATRLRSSHRTFPERSSLWSLCLCVRRIPIRAPFDFAQSKLRGNDKRCALHVLPRSSESAIFLAT